MSTAVSDLLSPLPAPTPAAMRAARVHAGQSQSQAAATCGLRSPARWAEYERGARVIDRARWALYLLATGQHPAAHVLERAQAERRRESRG